KAGQSPAERASGNRLLRAVSHCSGRNDTAMPPRTPPASLAQRDPRDFQIASLAGLLAYGLAALRFDLSPAVAALPRAAAVATQFAFPGICRLPEFEPRSALISGLSLCLVLRTNQPRLAALAAVLAVASKFLLRSRGKHIFNPTNVAIVLLLLFSDG